MDDLISLYIGKENVKTVIEAGALNCSDTLSMAFEFPNAHIYAFECNPDSVGVCKSAVEGNNRITLTPKALSDKAGTLTFYPIDTKKTTTIHADGNPGASSFFKANPDYTFEKYVQNEVLIEAITLEDFCKEKEIGEIDLIWLDAQGWELRILKGLGEKIKDVKMIKTEVLYKEQYIGAPLFDEVCEFLESKGFRPARKLDTYEWFGDVVFIRNDL